MDIKKLIGIVLLVGGLLVLGAVVNAQVFQNRAEKATSTSGTSSGSSGGLCDTVPEPYNAIFSKVGDKYKVKPEFLAAIFSIEHGAAEQYSTGYAPQKPHDSAWPEKAPGDPNNIIKWTTNPTSGALGPMQFMPATWEGYKDKVPLRPGSTAPDVQNITDAAYAAAYKLAMSGAGGNTKDESLLREAAAHYNGGTNPPASSYNDYAKKVLVNYNKYLCQGDDNLNDVIIKRILNYSPKPRPLMSPPGPTSIVLHWSGGSSLEGLISTLESRNRTEGIMCQLGAGKDGKVYQFMTTLNEKPVCQNAWNSHGIGMEIVGVGKSDLINDADQFQGVVKAVKYLMQKYNIPAINDTVNAKGILGHFQISSAKSDPSQEYLDKVLNAVK